MENRRRMTCSLLLVVAALSVAIGTRLARAESVVEETDQVSPLEGERINVRLNLWSTEFAGAKHRSGTAGGGGGHLYASTGDDLCNHGLGSGGNLEELRAESDHLWWTDVRVVDATLERIELEVDWSRYDAGQRVRGDRRTFTLGEDESHVLDFIDRPTSGEAPNCPRSMVVEIDATIAEDPELVDTRIRYDLWLTDEVQGEGRQTRHLQEIGLQGEELDVEFEPLRWLVPRGIFADGSRAEVVGEVSASLRGRIRRDGSLDVSLAASRSLGVAPAGQERKGGVGGNGERRVNVLLGEPVQLVLPTPRGSHTQWSADGYNQSVATSLSEAAATSPDGIATEEGMVRVAFEPFFRGHTMSLILTATVE